MKHLFALLLCFCLLTACTAAPTLAPTATAEPAATPVPPTPIPAASDVVSKLHWFGTSAILYNGTQKIYFDPISLAGTFPPADIVLITHAHTDHWSVNDLKKIIGPNTTLIISPNVSVAYETAKDELGIPATILEEGKTTEVNGVSVEAVPAFDTTYHRQGTGGVGYIVAVDGIRIYHAGGTAVYPEMSQYKPDVAILPMYTTAAVTDMMKLIPAKVFVIEHNSYYAAQAAGKLAKKDVLADDQMVADLKDGPFAP